MTVIKSVACGIMAAVALAGGGAARAGEVTVNNLSNDPVWVAVYSPGVQLKDTQCASVHGALRTNDQRTISFRGQDVYVRTLKGGQALGWSFPKTRLPFCDAAPFGVWTTEDPNILTLKWTVPGQPEHVRNWRKGTPLPAGWSMQDYYRVTNGTTLEVTP